MAKCPPEKMPMATPKITPMAVKHEATPHSHVGHFTRAIAPTHEHGKK